MSSLRWSFAGLLCPMACVAALCLPGLTQGAPSKDAPRAEKAMKAADVKAEPVKPLPAKGEKAPPPPAPLVNVAVSVNVTVNRNIDVQINTNLTPIPIIGSVKLPDLFQHLFDNLGFGKPAGSGTQPAPTGSR